MSGIIGRKEFKGGLKSRESNFDAQHQNSSRYSKTSRIEEAGGIAGVVVKCVNIGKNTKGEGSLLEYS